MRRLSIVTLLPNVTTGIAHTTGDAEAHSGRFVPAAGFAEPAGSRKANGRPADSPPADGESATPMVGHGPVRFAVSSRESRRVAIGFGDR